MKRDTLLLLGQGVVVGGIGLSDVVLVGELLEGLALGLGDEESNNETDEHEESKDLEQLGDEGVGTTAVLELGESDLGNDGTELSGTGSDTVTGGAVAGGEDLTGDDEGGRVGAEVLEELGGGKEEDKEGDRVVLDGMVGESEDAEEDAGHDETDDLDADTAEALDGEDGDPVTGDGTEEDDDDLADGGVPAGGPVVTLDTGKVDGRQDEGVVQTNTIEGNIESEPGHGGTEENLEVLPLGEVGAEVGEGALGGGGVGNDGIGSIILRLEVVAVLLEDGGNIALGLVEVVLDIQDVTGGLGNGQTEVDGDEGRQASETNDDTPDIVEVVDVGLDGGLEGSEEDDGDDTGGEVSKSLHGKDSGHHGTATVGGGELRGNDGGKGIVTTDTDTDNDTPDDQGSREREDITVSRESLTEGSNNNNHQLDTVHALASQAIGKGTESDLTDEGSNRGSDLDTKIQIRGEGTTVVDHAQHGGDEVDSEQIVGIGEETDTGDQTGADVEPAKLGIVNLGKCLATALVELVGVQLCVVVSGHDCM